MKVVSPILLRLSDFARGGFYSALCSTLTVIRGLPAFVTLICIAGAASAREYHVATTGANSNPGTQANPFRTISAAAEVAQPGDTITVHAGIYRERVDPPRGGESDSKRITYRAAEGDKVVITGSERVKGWIKEQGDTWKVAVTNSFFGAFNPFGDLIAGDWFHPEGRQAHTGAVYFDDRRLTEARALNDVFKPAKGAPLFFAEVSSDSTTVHAQFRGKDPNQAQVEVNVRQTVFYPAKNFINYITVRGFILQNAAPNWAAPTVEQKAVIGPNWAKGWIIENNLIRNSSCAGVSLGKYGDDWNCSGGPGYTNWNLTIERALKNGWNKDTIGHHIVRRNEIRDCDEAGIVGAMGCAFSTIERNQIYDIGVRRLLGGAELAGIKFHGAVDTLIRDNWIHHCIRGMHMDWMTQGTQITGNLMHNNDGQAAGTVGFYEAGGGQDIFLEVNHGPCVVANNILLSAESVFNASHGTLFAHNLMRDVSPTLPRWLPRKTPYLVPHSTAIAGEFDNRGGDDRFFNNLFLANASLAYYDTKAALPVMMDGNVFLKGTTPANAEIHPLVIPDLDPQVKIIERAGGWYLSLNAETSWRDTQKRTLVTTELLGKAKVPNQEYTNPDGSSLRIDTDYFGKPRNASNPLPGPFENPVNGEIKIWPK